MKITIMQWSSYRIVLSKESFIFRIAQPHKTKPSIVCCSKDLIPDYLGAKYVALKIKKAFKTY